MAPPRRAALREGPPAAGSSACAHQELLLGWESLLPVGPPVGQALALSALPSRGKPAPPEVPPALAEPPQPPRAAPPRRLAGWPRGAPVLCARVEVGCGPTAQPESSARGGAAPLRPQRRAQHPPLLVALELSSSQAADADKLAAEAARRRERTARLELEEALAAEHTRGDTAARAAAAAEQRLQQAVACLENEVGVLKSQLKDYADREREREMQAARQRAVRAELQLQEDIFAEGVQRGRLRRAETEAREELVREEQARRSRSPGDPPAQREHGASADTDGWDEDSAPPRQCGSAVHETLPEAVAGWPRRRLGAPRRPGSRADSDDSWSDLGECSPRMAPQGAPRPAAGGRARGFFAWLPGASSVAAAAAAPGRGQQDGF
eukprot:TRINITY_DN20026_c3_g1_i1.p1 TRINITY_DN20026_c3_g1~~TRINITY_DN20026_c3_g1_i1.p1  ORF type:complete len:381 (+),score=102.90 TRINITY_DN20026_c3_g1_i1:70-1212(+)